MSRFTMFETDYGLLEGEIYEGKLFLHFKFTGVKFNKRMYQQLLQDWITVRDELSSHGILKVYSLVENKDKVCKWQSMFGLKLIGKIQDNLLYEGEVSWV